MEKHKIQAIKYTLGGLAIGTFLAMGSAWYNNCSKNHNQVMTNHLEERVTKKVYSPLSYLEIRSKGKRIETISKKNSLTDNVILEFKLDSKRKVENMAEDSSLWGKTTLKSSHPGDEKNIDWTATNKTAQRYIAHFEK